MEPWPVRTDWFACIRCRRCSLQQDLALFSREPRWDSDVTAAGCNTIRG